MTSKESGLSVLINNLLCRDLLFRLVRNLWFPVEAGIGFLNYFWAGGFINPPASF